MEIEKMLQEVKEMLPNNYASEIASRIGDPKITSTDVWNIFAGRNKRVNVFLAVTEEAKKMIEDRKKAIDNLKSITTNA